MENRQKSYGKRYPIAKVTVKINKRKLWYVILGILIVSEIVLGVLWLLGY